MPFSMGFVGGASTPIETPQPLTLLNYSGESGIYSSAYPSGEPGDLFIAAISSGGQSFSGTSGLTIVDETINDSSNTIQIGYRILDGYESSWRSGSERYTWGWWLRAPAPISEVQVVRSATNYFTSATAALDNVTFSSSSDEGNAFSVAGAAAFGQVNENVDFIQFSPSIPSSVIRNADSNQAAAYGTSISQNSSVSQNSGMVSSFSNSGFQMTILAN